MGRRRRAKEIRGAYFLGSEKAQERSLQQDKPQVSSQDKEALQAAHREHGEVKQERPAGKGGRCEEEAGARSRNGWLWGGCAGRHLASFFPGKHERVLSFREGGRQGRGHISMMPDHGRVVSL
jgi:hypothetical protein